MSVALNIAEGSGRTQEDFKHCLSVARGSCYEIIPILEIAYRQKLIDAKTKEKLYNNVTILSKMLSGLRKSLTK
ncbi:four helix bundle protein [Candidatus Gottesmanbacteria bacterium]|nr:four helix bundle protein [Candidatus Gottesmanbacteria bacterium]